MIKVIAKYLLSFCILLLGGYNQLHAHKQKSSVHHVFTLNQELVCAGTVQENDALFIKPASTSPSDKKNQHHKLRVLFENQEADELNSFRKYLKSDTYLTFSLSAQIPVCILDSYNSVLHGNNRISFSSSYRYLLFAVFRI